MNIHFSTIYKKQTGEIVQCSTFVIPEGNSDALRQQFEIRAAAFGGEDYSYVDAKADPAKDYVAILRGEPVVVPRQNMRIRIRDGKTTLVANGVDTVELTGLPNPCTIVEDPGEPEETSYEVTGGGFVFSADTPGKYQFRVDRFPFLPFSVEFTAT